MMRTSFGFSSWWVPLFGWAVCSGRLLMRNLVHSTYALSVAIGGVFASRVAPFQGPSPGNRMVQKTNGEGQSVSYAYDDAGRLIEQTDRSGTRHVFHYDVPRTGNASVQCTLGRLAWAEEPSGREEFRY